MSKLLLVPADLDEVVYVLKKSGFSDSNWIKLGLRLGLLKSTLDHISGQYDSLDICLMECLSCWLKQVDKVNDKGGPTWIALTSSLRDIDEGVVANSIDEEKEPAYYILQKHLSRFQSLTDPVNVARLLRKEKVLSKEVFKSIEAVRPLPERISILFSSVQDAVCSDYCSLKTLGTVLNKADGNKSLGEDILKDYYKSFTDTSKMDCITLKGGDSVQECSTTDTSTDYAKIYVPRSMSSEFTGMRAKFGRMFLRVLEVFEKSQTSTAHLKRFLRFSYSDLARQLSDDSTLDDVLDLVKDKCSLINIKLLEEMVEEFKLKEAQKHINSYKEAIEEFCQATSVRLCLKETFQVTVPYTPLRCETVKFVVDWNPDECMLEDVRNLLSLAFEKLSLAVKVVVIKEGNSIVISCSFSMHLAMFLIAKAFDNLEKLKQKGLLSLTIGYVTVWNKESRNEEVRHLEEQINILTKQLKEIDGERMSFKQSLLEKEEEILNLKKLYKEGNRQKTEGGEVTWYRNGIALVSPTPQQCKYVISEVKEKLSQENIAREYILLNSSSPDSALVLLSMIDQTGITELEISHTPLNEDCMRYICQCISNNQLKRLEFYDTSLSGGLKKLANSLRNNTSLVQLDLENITISEGDVSLLSEVLTVNKSLQMLTLENCDISDNGVVALSSSLKYNHTLTYLDLTGNPLITGDGVFHLLEVLKTNSNIEKLEIDDEHKRSAQQFNEYVKIKEKIKFYDSEFDSTSDSDY